LLPSPGVPSARGRHRPGKHAAPRKPSRILVPVGLLLASGGAAIVGMAGLPTPSEASEVRPAALSVLPVPATASPLDRLPVSAAPIAPPAPTAETTTQADVERAVAAAHAITPARASRADRTAAPERKAAQKAAQKAERERVAKVRPDLVRPVPGPVTSRFGPRWGRLHAGVDFGVPVGTKVRAIADGVVTSSSYDEGGYGYHVVLRHPDGTTSLYAHLSRVAELGHRVTAGEVLGRSGNTGQSTGPHLHFEMRKGDRPFDPRPFLVARGVDL